MNKKSLIIGINNYLHFPPLSNCLNDAEDMHAFLKENGFESTLIADGTQCELIKKISEFKEAISEKNISLVYFSGHGLQDDKHNYIVASDSKIEIVEDIRYNCIHVDEFFINSSKNNLHIVILDACRSNPFSGGVKGCAIGLSKMDAPAGTLIAFSTSPNSTSIERIGERNGIYTKHLLESLQEPNLPVELAFKKTRNAVMADTSKKQIPWEESSLHGDNFSFVEREEDEIAKIANKWLENKEDISLLELLPLLDGPNFNYMPISILHLLLSLTKINSEKEDKSLMSATIDGDYMFTKLVDEYYPKFQNRLLAESQGSERFDLDILKKITLDGNINYGFNELEEMENAFPQMVINYIKYDGKEGLICFFLFPYDDQYFLKPLIVTRDKNIYYSDYLLMNGPLVHEISNYYFNMRKPLEMKSENNNEIFYWDKSI